MSIYKGSRYTKTQILTDSKGTPYTSERTEVTFTLSKCTSYIVIEGDTIDGIANKFYGNADYWWAIMDANRQYESELDISPGDILAIPDKSEVVNSL